MGMQYICDNCGNTVMLRDMHEVKITRMEDDKPSIKPIEVCVFCKEKIIEAISKINSLQAVADV